LVFKDFFRKPGIVPDAFIIFDNNHDNGLGTLATYRTLLSELLNLIEDNVNQSTPIIWLSKPSFNPKKAAPGMEKESFRRKIISQ